MAEIVELGVIGSQDASFGYGTFSQNLWGTTTALNKINLSDLYAAYTVAFSATPVFDLQNGQLQTITLTGNVTSSTFQNDSTTIPAGAKLVLRIVQDGTGGHSFVFPTSVSNGTTLPINTAASAVTHIEFQYSGSAWETVGLIGGGGSGLTNYLAKFTGPNGVTNSDFYDSGSGQARYLKSQNAETRFAIVNETDDTASSARLRVGGKVTSDDSIAVSLMAQKANNTTVTGWNLSGVLRSESGATSGLICATAAGPIRFQPADATAAGLFKTDTYYNFEVGTTSATATNAMPLYVRRDFNDEAGVWVVNSTSGTNARASFVAKASTGAVYFGVTSAGYTTQNVPGSMGYLFSSVTATNGMAIRTNTGDLTFQINAGTDEANFAVTHRLTSNEFQVSGRYRALTLTKSSPTTGTSADLFCDGAGYLVAATWGASEAATSLIAQNYLAVSHEWFTASTYSGADSRMILGQGLQLGSPTSGDQGEGTLNVSSKYYVNGTQVVAARQTGWTAWSGTASRATRATSTVTTEQIAQALFALLTDLAAHGLINP